MRGRYIGVPDVGEIPAMSDGMGDVAPFVEPARDGKPWRKCCGECQFLDPMQRRPIMDECWRKEAAFYCVHRTEDTDEHRVCAGFAAYDRRALAAASTALPGQAETSGEKHDG